MIKLSWEYIIEVQEQNHWHAHRLANVLVRSPPKTVVLAASGSFLAEISVGPPQKLFIFNTKKKFFSGSKNQPKKWFWEQKHWLLQIRQAGLKGLGLSTSPTSSTTDPAIQSTQPTFDAMLAMARKQHPRLTGSPTPTASLVMNGASLLALLQLLDVCRGGGNDKDGSTSALEGSTAMAVDGDESEQEEHEKCRDRKSEGYMLLLEHALTRYAPSTAKQSWPMYC